MKKWTAAFLVGALAFSGASSPAFAAKKKKKHPVVTIVTSISPDPIQVELWPDRAPKTVKNFLTYVKEKHYDGTIFHRVIPQFMIQGGGMLPDMKEKGGTHSPVKNEASKDAPNKEGTIAMARTPDPNSATDQFFINVKDNGFLDYKDEQNPGYAVFGKVTSGMDVVHKIETVPTTDKPPHANVPIEPVIIKSIRVSK